MPHNPSMRASDNDRERVAGALRDHHAQGRLSIEEFHERLDVVYSVRTLGDLDRLTADLPEEDLYQLPVPASQQAQPSRGFVRDMVGTAGSGALSPRARRNILRVSWAAWATVSALNLLLWVLVSSTMLEFVYPWWIWVAGPWGVLQLGATWMLRRDD